ncbi:two-component regulator propeller domain-containing protein [Gilvimarinus sp. SDUM040013]|uniref:diguanylate cyclase n=1 Tax=Gilvimarinus gilvus TaxID=3058038 RepID=A0ABU4S1Z8_9GAMM|nr:ligand-binding sensor domain-containing diguanylate cyclase [Gilvimarinus sp. SDUM040013]MDO3384776.1 two-component regulator propeller domain-containing protein [Gilvimarinus sp. SDUM040013]MDX6850406.1 two-component regulator propeller domain-containing protein [Gilvimarinus sp. SDUM040013]
MQRDFLKTLTLLLLVAGSAVTAETKNPASAAPTIRFDNPFDQSDAGSHLLGGVIDIIQDEKGFIWLGGENGLGRYDGRDLKLYQADSSSERSLSGNYVWSLALDKDGVLWQATGGGLSRYNERTEDFTQYLQFGDTRFISGSLSSLAVGEDNTLYVGGIRSLYAINPTRTAMSIYQPAPPISRGPNVGQVQDLSIDSDGRVWMAMAGMGVAIFDPATASFEYLLHNPNDANSIAYNHVRVIVHDKQGRTWLGTYGNGISLLDHATGKFTHYAHDPDDPFSLEVNIIWDITLDSEGVVWVALDQGGLARFDETTQSFHHYHNAPYDSHSLISDQVRVVYEDNNSDLWIGAFPAGVSFYNRSTQVFRHHTSRPNDPSSLSNNAILAMLESEDGTIWVGTENGLNALDSRNDRVRRYMSDPDSPYGLKANPVLALEEDTNGQLWVGTWAGGLHRFDPDTGRFYNYSNQSDNPGSINDDFIWSLLLSRDQTLWVGTENGGLNRYHRDTDSFSHYINQEGQDNTISGNYLPALLEDQSGRLWIGTYPGLDLFDPDTETFTPATQASVTSQPGDDLNIRSLHEDNQGRIWIGTDQGVNIYHPNTGEVRHINVQEGLPSSSVSSILEDERGDIWLATTNGLARIGSDLTVIATYSRDNGLAGSNYNRDASLKDSQGLLYFGSTEGITVFNPEDLNKHGANFPVVITNLRILNRAAPIGVKGSPLSTSILTTDELTLTHEDTMFSFDLAALNFRQNNTMRYSYQLEGFDRGWNNIGRNTSATYTNINSGEYRFRTRASVNGENWVEGQTIAITILPPPWRSWWAYCIYLAILAVLLWFAHKYITLQVRAEAYRSKSMTDPLTQLYNRAGIAQVSEGIFANPTTKKGMCLMIMDIDHFKRVNDRRGHDAGDRILCDVSRIVRDCLRTSDHFGRWGGEEFILMCPTHGHASSHYLAEKVRKTVEAHTYEQHSRKPIHLSVSIGLVDIEPEDSFESALKRADNALYKAKELGRNCVVMAD